jgi:dephospho-CoA kinase
MKSLPLRKIRIMSEIIFIVEESAEGGFEAKALGESIFTEAESMEELKENIREAIRCHYDENAPKVVRLHYVKEEVFAA